MIPVLKSYFFHSNDMIARDYAWFVPGRLTEGCPSPKTQLTESNKGISRASAGEQKTKKNYNKLRILWNSKVFLSFSVVFNWFSLVVQWPGPGRGRGSWCTTTPPDALDTRRFNTR